MKWLLKFVLVLIFPGTNLEREQLLHEALFALIGFGQSCYTAEDDKDNNKDAVYEYFTSSTLEVPQQAGSTVLCYDIC